MTMLKETTFFSSYDFEFSTGRKTYISIRVFNALQMNFSLQPMLF